MNNAPTQTELQEVGISQAYASLILGGKRNPSTSTAIRIYRKTGWKHAVIADLTDSEIAVLERVAA